MDWAQIGQEILVILAFIGVYSILFLVAKAMKDFLTPYHLIEELAVKDNVAVGISLSGYFLATALIFVGVVSGPSRGFLDDIFLVVGYSLLGLVFLNLTRWCLDHVIFREFCNNKEIVEDQNCGMAAVRGGAYVATGLIAAGSLHGEGGSVFTASAFFVLGQAALFAFARIYDFTTPYHLQDQVQEDNVAAGIAFGGTLVALGIVLGKAVSGNFIGWTENLILFAELAITGIVLLQIIRVLMDKLVLTGHDLNQEISEDRNKAAGFLEMSVALCFAMVLVALI